MRDADRTVRSRAAAVLVVVLAGCGPLQRQPIPSPFPEQAPYGAVVREIRIVGNGATDERVVRESMVTRVGRPYTRENALRDHARLSQLGVFTTVLFATEPADGGIAVTVEVAEVNRFLPSLSVALTEENGLEIGPSASTPNLLGRGAKASGLARFGGARNLGFSFRDAWHPTPAWHGCCFEVEIYHRERHNALDDFEEGSNEAAVQYLYNLTDRIHVGARLSYLGIRAREDSTGAVPDITLNPGGTDRIPGLGVVAEYDSRNLISYPTRGWYVAVAGTRYGGPLGGVADYGRLELDARRYLEVAGPRHALAAYSLLTLTEGEMGRDIPIHQDFHLGGTNSVRGWPLDSRSGKSQWINTVEYWWDAVPQSAFRFFFLRWSMGLQLAAFADVATAWDDRAEFDANWIGGGGVGARLTVSHMGLLRFDVGVGRTHPDLGVSIHIGGGERAIAQKRRVR